MGIYRGAGGSGDAVNDASSEALITVQAKEAALAAQAAAELARDAAQLAETNAETAETNAETAETNAETAATNAAASASAASTSASNAATSATNAANSATAAQTAETNAETAETNAAASASAASTSASNAATSATNASNSASAAATSATNASNSASAAATSATNAANSATAAQTAQTAAELAETNAETAEANAETAEANAAASASAAATSASNASTSASNAASSASSASTSASNAATSATNAANSATAASTSATNAANSASAALTSENNAASSASAAATSASNAATSATSASNSASAAATSETNAANSASAASTSATNAANSASAASTSASNAATSETNAATSATNAASSASAASTSASNAAASESNAASSASAAAASYDSFDDRYLGAKSSAPTLDNDGNTLLVGALYFNTTTNEMKVWDGSTWLNAYASLSGALLATNNLSDLNNTATARANLGVAIGTNVQAWDADLDTWATKTAPSGTVVGTSDSQTLTNKTIALGSNTISGTLAQFNTAVTDADLVSLAGTETLTNKTISGTNNTISNIGNSSLTNSSITINGVATSLGGSINVGTVTSVSATSPVSSSGGNTPTISLASGYGDTQNPYASKTANFFLAAPNGSSGVPSFRAIVAADIPTLNQNTTGNAATATTATNQSGGTVNATTGAFSGITSITNATSSTNSSTGALVVTGGVGIGGVTNVNNYVNRITGSGNSAWLQQDGTGRVHWYWNTYGGTSPTFTNANEDASAVSLHVTGTGAGGSFFHRSASGVGQSAGSPITWTTTIYSDLNNFTWKGNAVLRSDNYNSYAPTLTGGGASGTWGINITGNAATITSQANSATITASTGVVANQIVQRDANGYIYTNYVNHSSSETENPTINSVFVSNGDGWTRKATVAHFRNSLGSGTPSSSTFLRGDGTWVAPTGGQFFGSAVTKAIAYNSATIAENITVTAGNNGLSAGPITINSGFTVTVETGANWVIV